MQDNRRARLALAAIVPIIGGDETITHHERLEKFSIWLDAIDHNF
jgi:hypothetical protein